MKRKLISLFKIKAVSWVLYLGFGLTCSSWLACSTIHKRQQLASVRQSANIQTSLQSQKLLELQRVDSNRQAFKMTIWPKSVFRINPDGSWESDAGRVEVWGESNQNRGWKSRQVIQHDLNQQVALQLKQKSAEQELIRKPTSFSLTPLWWLLVLIVVYVLYKLFRT